MILDAFSDLDWVAVAVSAVAAFAIGALWFSPAVLDSTWARQVERYSGTLEADTMAHASRPEVLGKWLVGLALVAVVLGLVIESIGADSAGDGIVLGLVLAVGLGATSSSWPPVFARMPWAWWLINNGAFLAMLLAMGAIQGAWQ